MKVEFEERVNEALSILRRQDFESMGQHDLARLKIVQKRMPKAWQDELSATFIGKEICDLLKDVIDGLKPQVRRAADNPSWQCYLVLKNYVVRRDSWQKVSLDLNVGKAKFFEIRKQAVKKVALELWELEHNALQESGAVDHNLPRSPYTKFVERHDESGRSYVGKIIDTLNNKRAWIVIIDGPAGAGKTALAYKVAEECVNRKLFESVIWISAKQWELNPEGGIDSLPEHLYVTSLGEILDTIGKTVGNIRKVMTVPSLNEKKRLVREILLANNCLIIIDNLEELDVDTFDSVRTFLGDLPPPSKALLTSRERHYVGEIREPLRGMTKDEAYRFIQLQSEARRLRALSNEEMQLVYSKTEGIPLAMKYALGQMAVFGYPVYDAIGTGSQHRVLIDFMFETAYGRLEPAEKEVLHHTSILPEPASVEAIKIAGGRGRTQTEAVLGKLYQLFFVDKVGPRRYYTLPYVRRFLDSIREEDTRLGGDFGKEFIKKACLNLVDYYTNVLKGPDIDAHLTFLKNEKQNIFAMLDWCYESREPSLLIELVEVIGRPLGILGYAEDRIAWGRRAMQMCEALGETQRKARFAIKDVAWAYIRSSRSNQAKTLLEENLELSKKHGYLPEGALALHNLGRLYRNMQQPSDASRLLKEALSIWRNLGDREWQARSGAVLGRIEYKLGNISQAHAYLEEALRLREEVKHENEIIETQADLSLVLFAEGNEREAALLLDESLYRGEQLPGPGPTYAYALYRDAEFNQYLGNLMRSCESAEQAYRIYENFGVVYMAKEEQRFLSTLECVQ